MSSGRPIRPIGVIAAILPSSSSFRNGRSALVSTAPTAIAFTRTAGATSAASAFVM
jgi:hypothetical protein